jgi:hypothetical protein
MLAYRPLCLALLGSALSLAAVGQPLSGFVSVSAGSFVLDGQPFQPTGTNQYVLSHSALAASVCAGAPERTVAWCTGAL